MILLGPPGSGKGTQGALLASVAGIPEISTGEMLRRECGSGTKLGNAIQSLLTAGKLVSDELVNQAVANRLRRSDCQNGCILDGYPRTVSQARFLDDLLAELNMSPPLAFDFQVDCEEIINRLSRRYHCPECGRSFSISDEVDGAGVTCDRDGAPLLRRADDNPTSIRERLRLHEANASAVVNYYRSKAYHRIPATRPIEEISRHIIGIASSVLGVVQSRSNSVSALA